MPAEVKTLKDFLAWAKANPDKANYGSPGAGSMPHLLGALLGLRAGVPLRHVPYRGTVPSITDLVGGQVSAAMNPSGDYLQYMKAGRVRVLATSGRQRSPYLPDVPTFTELGYPDVTSEEWFGFYAPARTPAATLANANAAIHQALKDKAVIDSLRAGRPAGTTQHRPGDGRRPEGGIRALGAAGQADRLHRRVLKTARPPR